MIHPTTRPPSLQHAREDVLIPVAQGTKRPTVKYGLPGSWTWASFDAFRAEHEGEPWDWCVCKQPLQDRARAQTSAMSCP